MKSHDHPFIGRPLTSRSNADLLAGQGYFTDDVALTSPLFLCFLRSFLPAGEIDTVDISDASMAPGVVGVYVGADVAHLGKLAVNPLLDITVQLGFPVLALDQLQAVGQPLAAVLAQTLPQAQDACDLIDAQLDQTTPHSQEIAHKSWHSGDVAQAMAQADHIVECSIQHARLAASPMEPRAIAVAYDPAKHAVTIWQSTQTPHRSRNSLADILGLDPARIRVIAPHVGGAFGLKASLYPEEVFAVWAALHYKRDVKWTATRSEEFLSATHGRGVQTTGRLALTGKGKFLALEANITAPVGHWLPNSGLTTGWNAARILPSGYQIDALDISTRAVSHNLAPTGIYRGAGRPEANSLMERLVDMAAAKTGLDPVEIRQLNLLTKDALPHQTGTGNILDSGDYPRALSMLKQHSQYSALLVAQKQRRAQGALVGIGIAFFLEPSGDGWETAQVTLTQDGRVLVASGSSSQGHGRKVGLAQIAAETLDLPFDQIDVIFGDTATCPEGIGALASRSTAIGGSAVLLACQDINKRLAAGETTPITADIRYETEGQAWGYGAYLVMLSVDRDTGLITLEKTLAVDDAGRIINPALAQGQVSGGFAQGVGEALMEQVIYDNDGQLLTGSFMDYALPRAADIPQLEQHKFETFSLMNPLGAKGIGEAGTIGAPAAILNAAYDALRPLGVKHLQMPLTSYAIWQAMQSAAKGTTR